MVVTCRSCAIITGITQVRTAALSQTPMTTAELASGQPQMLAHDPQERHRLGTIEFRRRAVDVTGIWFGLSRVRSESIVGERHHVEAAAGRGGERLRDGGSDRRQRHLGSRLRLTCPVNERAGRR